MVRHYQGQNYSKLHKQATTSGQPFNDPLFPPTGASLGFSENQEIVWKRPGEICEDPKLVVDGVTDTDLNQGVLGNCWFVAACSCLASEKKLWEKVIPHWKQQSITMASDPPPSFRVITSTDLAHEMHAETSLFLLDCRPVLSYAACHISGAVNINLASMMKKRFMAGRIRLVDLLTSPEGKDKLKNGQPLQVVVYDDCTNDPKTLPSNNTVFLVFMALEKMGKTPRFLKGGLTEFGVLHPSLCELSVSPLQRAHSIGLRATTPGQRDQALDWQTAPPVFILSYLILGSEKDARSKEVLQEFGVKYILNVTTKCPNYFEAEGGFKYKRIAAIDTGTQKLSQHFEEAFDFIEQARKMKGCILIHCMAGISRSVTLTIAYLIRYFQMPMQAAYQYVKERRPAISPNLNFMGQLVEFEGCKDNNKCESLKMNDYTPSSEQDDMSEKMKGRLSGGSSKDNTPEASRNSPEAPKLVGSDQPRFVLKLPGPIKRKNKKKVSPRTSPRILTEDSVDLPKKQNASDTRKPCGGDGGAGMRDEHI